MTDERGLTDLAVSERRRKGQGNGISAYSGLTERQIILRHCVTYFNFIFLILAVILALSGSGIQNMTFMVVVLVNTAIGIVQQIRAKRAVEALTLIAAQTVKTRRNGEWVRVRSDLLVQDDLVEFSSGDQICADGIVISGDLQVNEALLTGEAEGVQKQVGESVLSGSFVLSGTGRVQLTAVGDQAFAAKLAREAKENPEAAKSGMMKALDRLIWVMGVLLIPVGLLLFYQEYAILQSGFRTGAEATVAALVGMIPEGLYLLTSVAMAASALKLTRDRVLVQDMNCIETLARVDVLCVDKTGTITCPEMAVEEVVLLENADPQMIRGILAALYRDRSDNDTAKAMAAYFVGEGEPVCEKYIPFDPVQKWCGGHFEFGNYIVGAPEFVMGQDYQRIAPMIEPHIQKGYRVLLLAQVESPLIQGQPAPQGAEPMALILLHNPLRENAVETFRYFHQQGVAVKVISGDNPVTASRVALRAEIPGGECWVDASKLKTQAEIESAVCNYTVFGRVTPDMKKKLILAMKKAGHTVAMTGDGVNDVLALKEADCSVAMAGGAPAAGQVARLVLTDSDFAAMPGIVAEGRRVINNIQRAAALFLVKNILSLGLAVFCVISGWAYPFKPFHLSVIAALTIGVPGFFLAMEPNNRPVRGRFLPTVIRQALPGGLTNILVTIGVCFFMGRMGLPKGDMATVCTAVLAVVGLLVLFQVSRPMSGFRGVIWLCMAVALLGSFAVLGKPFDLTIADPKSFFVLALAAVVAIVTFFAVSMLFKLTDRR